MLDQSLFDSFHRVALAVSGGKDSMTLLYEFERSFPHDFFYVINIEHGIRGEESVRDSEFVENYCKSIGVKCVRYNVDAIAYSEQHGYTLEQGARLLRREIFKGEIDKGNCDRVVVAHHLDDNVESVLMHMFRGSGLRGMRGMDVDDGMLLRPLLGISRAEIDEMVERYHIPFREDATNSDSSYSRNFLRHDIIPELMRRYPTLGSSIMRLSNSAREDDDFLTDMADAHVRREGDRVLVDTDIDKVLFKRAVYRAFTMLGVTADVEERHYNLLLDLAKSKTGTSLDMPYGVVARMEYKAIALYRPHESDTRELPLALGDTVIGDYIVRIDQHIGDIDNREVDGYRVLYVDQDKVTGATIRSRESGDMFERYKGGRKKLKDYLIDIKMPALLRDIPLIVRGHEVLVVTGTEIANNVCISDDTTKIYSIQVRRRDR